MARHHHNRHPASPSSPPPHRPLPLRLLSVLSLLFPPILYLISLSFTLKAIYEPAFAVSTVLGGADLLPVRSDPADNSSAPYAYLASPFYTCTPTLTNVSNAASIVPGSFSLSCSRIAKPLGGAGRNSCFTTHAGISELFCQKYVITAELYVAGAVLIGIALLFSFVLASVSFRAAWAPVGYGYAYVPSATSTDNEHEHNSEHEGKPHHEPGAESSVGSKTKGTGSTTSVWLSLLASFIVLLAVLATVLIALAQVLGVNVLVDSEFPSGEVAEPDAQTGDVYQSPWFMGPGALVYSSVAWLAALLGAFVAGSGCGVRGF